MWNFITIITQSNQNWKVPLIALTSIGVYKLFMVIFKWLILKIRFLKKIVFGAYYFEGVWVGFFVGKQGKVSYYVETFEQDFDGIIIRGKGFRETEGYFGSWISENVSVNIRKGTLNYTYECDAFSNSFINPGLASFVLERKTITSPPHRLIGFSADLYNPKKLKSFEEKICDKPDIKDIQIMINKAEELNNQHRYFLSTGDERNNAN
jgi:hypothetical protein